MKAVPGILPTLLEMIYFFSTPTIDVEPEKIRPGFETDAEKTRYGPGAFCLGPHLIIKGKRRFLQVVWGQIFSRMSWPILWVPMTC